MLKHEWTQHSTENIYIRFAAQWKSDRATAGNIKAKSNDNGEKPFKPFIFLVLNFTTC